MIIVADLEGTLTQGHVMTGLGRYFLSHGRALSFITFLLWQWLKLPLLALHLMSPDDYSDAGMTDLAHLFSGMTIDEVKIVAEWVVVRQLWPKRFNTILAELVDLQSQGYRLILNSGTYQPVAEAFAQRIGAEAIGTPLAFSDGRATGSTGGAVNRRQVKVERLRPFLNGDAVEHSYSNDLADVPILEISHQPVVINPKKQLREIAQRGAWRIVTAEAVVG
jgi:phosphoserine phosphatase